MDKNLFIAVILLVVAAIFYFFGIARQKTGAGFLYRFILWAIILYCLLSGLWGLFFLPIVK